MSTPAPGVAPTVLLVDDEESFVVSLTHVLKQEGYRVLSAADGASALEKALEESPDVILLDLMLPGMSGLAVCRAIRERTDVPQPGIIMVTAKSSEVDQVVGLETGADDYVTKPFTMSLLLARMRALLRRRRREVESSLIPQTEKPSTIGIGKLTVNPGAYEASCQGSLLDLSPRLFEILMYLIRNMGKVVTRDELLNNVWGYDYVGQTRTVDVHMHWLREQLARHGCDDIIQTIRGVGYKLASPGESTS